MVMRANPCAGLYQAAAAGTVAARPMVNAYGCLPTCFALARAAPSGTADSSTGCRCAPGAVQLSAAQLEVRARCCAEEKQLRSCTPIRLKLERC